MVLAIAYISRKRLTRWTTIAKIPDVLSSVSNLVGQRDIKRKTPGRIIDHTANGRHYVRTNAGRD